MDIPAHLSKEINEVRRVYEKLDDKIAKFQTDSALKCASGCGRCCENPHVFITVLEVLPLAYELWQRGTAEMILAKIVDPAVPTICVFYQPDPLITGNGRCGVYEWRPLLCRLFGYAAILDKHGRPQLVTCPTMKAFCVREYEQTSECLAAGKLTVPLMQEYAMQILNIDPYLGKEQLPINQAVKIALEKVGMVFTREEFLDK